jgi:hypothetical protein
MQDLLIDQASAVDDKVDAPHAQADIENFIRRVRVVALSKAPAADSAAES